MLLKYNVLYMENPFQFSSLYKYKMLFPHTLGGVYRLGFTVVLHYQYFSCMILCLCFIVLRVSFLVFLSELLWLRYLSLFFFFPVARCHVNF
jgi:hypothetical protein